MAGQFENPANPDYHYETTAAEIFEQMDGQLDAVVIGSGTAGTFTGVARYMKEHLPKVLAYAVEPEGSILGGGKPGKHKVEGIGASFIPKNFDRSVCDEVITVSDVDAFAMVKQLAAREGVLAGSSGGANVVLHLYWLPSDWGRGSAWLRSSPTQRNVTCPKRFLRVGFKKLSAVSFQPGRFGNCPRGLTAES